ncbi:hypothetical protein ZEAMMB73_Zm00001d002437 [Zea mays]|uniref:Uncharacterized protein n=1 Tax=Zea mays TaxID=4577 RepID=A0A1D6E0Q8_MAIZE|nr:hypothetical protein ZEAMMB73_Zm00001d002437 [Zea mays]
MALFCVWQSEQSHSVSLFGSRILCLVLDLPVIAAAANISTLPSKLGGEKVVYDATKKIFSSSSGLAEDILFLFTDWLSLLREIVNIETRVHT